jgi:hypothetical protein
MKLDNFHKEQQLGVLPDNHKHEDFYRATEESGGIHTNQNSGLDISRESSFLPAKISPRPERSDMETDLRARATMNLLHSSQWRKVAFLGAFSISCLMMDGRHADIIKRYNIGQTSTTSPQHRFPLLEIDLLLVPILLNTTGLI